MHVHMLHKTEKSTVKGENVFKIKVFIRGLNSTESNCLAVGRSSGLLLEKFLF